jgi:threonine/homoserine/homoserine lactone efflux protein
METLLAVVGIVTVASITPGPNNFVVMAAAVRGGPGAAVPAMLGVVLGALALIVLVWAGAGVVFETLPLLRRLFLFAGALYLIWLGVVMLWHSRAAVEGQSARAPKALPQTTIGLAIFQIVNPKAWVLVLTATTAISSEMSGLQSLTILAFIFIPISGICLTLWALAGVLISSGLAEAKFKRWFDQVMAVLLIGSALMLMGE